jgi:arylsulfatase
MLDYLTGKAKESPRQLFFYFSDDGDVLAIRYDNWKLVFMEQRAQGTLRIWAEPFTPLRLPKMFNLRTDPYERADITSNRYYDWILYNAYFIYAAQLVAGKFVETFKEFPAAQHAGSFTIDAAMAKMTEAASGTGH